MDRSRARRLAFVSVVSVVVLVAAGVAAVVVTPDYDDEVWTFEDATLTHEELRGPMTLHENESKTVEFEFAWIRESGYYVGSPRYHDHIRSVSSSHGRLSMRSEYDADANASYLRKEREGYVYERYEAGGVAVHRIGWDSEDGYEAGVAAHGDGTYDEYTLLRADEDARVVVGAKELDADAAGPTSIWGQAKMVLWQLPPVESVGDGAFEAVRGGPFTEAAGSVETSGGNATLDVEAVQDPAFGIGQAPPSEATLGTRALGPTKRVAVSASVTEEASLARPPVWYEEGAAALDAD